MEEIWHTRGSAYYANDDTSSNNNEDAGGNNAFLLTPTQEADAALLESISVASTTTATTEEGLRIQPQAGRLLLFFSRMDNGEIDPRSWHGGERLVPVVASTPTPAVVEKKIVTFFKEVSYGTTPEHPLSFGDADNNMTFENYLSPQVSEQRRFLTALAESHAPFFDQ